MTFCNKTLYIQQNRSSKCNLGFFTILHKTTNKNIHYIFRVKMSFQEHVVKMKQRQNYQNSHNLSSKQKQPLQRREGM